MKENLSWKQAFKESPGPNNWRQAFILAGKGLAMGTADIIPGVSGGTIAFITGIYEDLIKAIKSIDTYFLKKAIQFKFKDAIARAHIRFLLPLVSGIAIAIITLSGLMSYLLHSHQVLTWSFFFGLILASVLLIGKKINNFFGLGGVGLLLGIILGYGLVGLIPISTPVNWWFILLSGVVTITAMILPGISGAFILLILGKYEFMIQALKNPFLLDNFLSITCFISGCTIGVVLFARFFNFLFSKYYNFTIALLTGLIAGSLRKIWPWKEVIESKLINNELHVIGEKNILPLISSELVWSSGLIILGFILVMLLSKNFVKK